MEGPTSTAAEPPQPPKGVMVAELRVLSALCALVAAVTMVWAG